MTDRPDDPEEPGPFPTSFPPSPFPPLEGELSAHPADPPSDWNRTADAHDLSVAHEATRQNALIALGRFAFPPEPYLDDEGVAARDRRWTSRAIVFAAVFLLIFNAVSIQNWSRQQAPGWVTSTVQQLADVWGAQIAQLGADQPRQGMRETYEHMRAQRFPGQAPDGSTTPEGAGG